MQSDYKKDLRRIVETPACQDMNFGAEELTRVQSSELSVAE
jgi:hypothetical protein